MRGSVLEKILVIAFIVGTFGEKLSSVENEQIQQICGAYTKPMKNKVMYGVRAEPSEAPWAVSIGVYREEGVMHCSGTLISSRHVVTARHCFVRDYSRGSFTYVFNEKKVDFRNCRGNDYIVPPDMSEAELHFATKCRDEEACEAINLSPNLVTRKTALVVLPGICAFRSKNYLDQDDFAIIELDRDVLFSELIHPICVAKDMRGVNAGDNITLHGFGFDPSDKEVSTGILKYESSHIVKCTYSKKYVCSFSYDNVQLACRGDSGGGVVFEGNDKITLVAVLSRGEACRLNVKYQADILAPVYIYRNEICEYTGICEIESQGSKHNVKKLYGHEAVRVLPKLGFQQKTLHSIFMIICVNLVLI